MNWLGALFLAVVILFGVLTGRFYLRQMRNSQQIESVHDRVNAQTEIYKVAAEFAAGLAIFTGLALTWVQFNESRGQFEKTIKSQEDQITLSRGQLDLARRAQAAERINSGITNLGSEDASVRAGGVLTLEQVGREFSAEYRLIAANLITSFLKRRSTQNGYEAAKRGGDRWPTADVHAALVAVTRLVPEAERPTTDLRFIFLSNATLRGLVAPELNFDRALFNSSDLEGAVLSSARLHQASFIGANLRKTNLSKSHLEDSNLQGADLSIANLMGASLEGADLREVKLSVANLAGANLVGADLRGARMVGAKLDGADLSKADLRGAEMLTQGQIELARGNSSTQLPATIRMPDGWR